MGFFNRTKRARASAPLYEFEWINPPGPGAEAAIYVPKTGYPLTAMVGGATMVSGNGLIATLLGPTPMRVPGEIVPAASITYGNQPAGQVFQQPSIVPFDCSSSNCDDNCCSCGE